MRRLSFHSLFPPQRVKRRFAREYEAKGSGAERERDREIPGARPADQVENDQAVHVGGGARTHAEKAQYRVRHRSHRAPRRVKSAPFIATKAAGRSLFVRVSMDLKDSGRRVARVGELALGEPVGATHAIYAFYFASACFVWPFLQISASNDLGNRISVGFLSACRRRRVYEARVRANRECS